MRTASRSESRPLECVTRLLAIALLGPLLQAQGDPAAAPAARRTVDRLLVCNKADHSLSIFDPDELREIVLVRTGDGPHEVAVSPDGRTAVVADYGAQKPGTTLTVVDLAGLAVARTIHLVRTEAGPDGGAVERVLPRPHGLQFVDATSVIVTSESARRLALVDAQRGVVTRTWTTPQATMHMVALSPDRRLAHATSIKDGDLATFALTGDETKARAVVATGDGAEGLAVHPGTGDIWVGNRAADTITVVDGTTGKAGDPIATGDFPFRIAFTPDGSRALVSCAESGEVQVFEARTRKLLRSISIQADVSEVSPLPMGICVDTAGERAFVACGRGEFVAILGLRDGKVLHRLPARSGPDGIAFARVPVDAEAGSPLRR